MKKEYCQDCVCLVEGDNGEWVCDECQKPIDEVEYCPEFYADLLMEQQEQM